MQKVGDVPSDKQIFHEYNKSRISKNTYEFEKERGMRTEENNTFQSNLDYILSLLNGPYKKDFIERLAIDTSTFTRWKNHTVLPDAYNRERIAEYLGISVEQLTAEKLCEMPEISMVLCKLIVISRIEEMSKEQFADFQKEFDRIRKEGAR